jgi:toxin-antitoxin system PIN domain toxin
MKVVDANILLYAVNQDAPRHEAVRKWWEAAVAGEEPVGLCWIVLLAFLRIATRPRAFARPLTPERAIAIVTQWLDHANVRVVSESDEHWTILRGLLEETGVAGNLTADAHLAALAISRGAVLASCDADFSRFRGLRWENPLLASERDNGS